MIYRLPTYTSPQYQLYGLKRWSYVAISLSGVMLYFDKKNTIWIRGSDWSSDCNTTKHEYQVAPMFEIIANHGEPPSIKITILVT